MRILSWNVYNRRSHVTGVLDVLARYQPDVAALQEVSEEVVRGLESDGGWSVYVADDFIERGEVSHLATLTRVPSRHEKVAVNSRRATSRSLVGWLFRWTECIEAQVVFLETDSPLAVVNLHLACAVSPRTRMQQLDAILNLARPDNCVVCGDFNTFGVGGIRLAGPLFGFSLSDMLRDERDVLEKTLEAAGFAVAVPEQDRPTLPRFRLVLDHFAVSKELIATASVLPELEGSDHHPILLDLDHRQVDRGQP